MLMYTSNLFSHEHNVYTVMKIFMFEQTKSRKYKSTYLTARGAYSTHALILYCQIIGCKRLCSYKLHIYLLVITYCDLFKQMCILLLMKQTRQQATNEIRLDSKQPMKQTRLQATNPLLDQVDTGHMSYLMERSGNCS